MKKINLIILVLALLALFAADRSAAAPARQGTNLLQNPGFERPYTNDGAAHDWVRWHRESSPDRFGDCTNGYHKRPRWGDAIDIVYEGSISQYIGNNWDTWAGGVWQTVSVTPGSTYRFTFYAWGRGSMEGFPAPSYPPLNMNVRAGIDPNGSGLWNDSDVVWGSAGSPHDQWQQFSVEATATGDKITVFTAADWAVPGVNQCYKHLDTYYDAAQLVEIGPPPTNTPLPQPTLPPPPPATATPIPPTDTPTPAVTPTDTPVPTDTPSPTPAGGTICVNAFADENGNGLHDDNEGYMAGVTFTIASTEQMVGQAISPGTSTPVCFEGVTPGTYQVTQIVPGRLEMTTAGSATIEVAVGQPIGLEFGSRIRPDTVGSSTDSDAVASNTDLPTAVPEDTNSSAASADSGDFSLLSVSGIAVMVLAVILLGALIFLLLRRQTGQSTP